MMKYFLLIIMISFMVSCSKETFTVKNFNTRGVVMKGFNKEIYTDFDKNEISAFLFHPRKETSWKTAGTLIDIPVEDNVKIGALLHHHEEKSPFILFFHGNGEIASDYNDLAPFFNRLGLNFMVVDYRGYGTSTGTPSVSLMIHDAHKIFAFTKTLMKEKNYTGKLIVMGRSLGSASAIELCKNYSSEIDALIIESGFAYIVPLLNLLGISTQKTGIKEDRGFRHIEKISHCTMSTLVIHAEKDHIIPFSDGQALYENSGATNKKMLSIPQANHNTIFMYGMDQYLNAVDELVKSL